MGFFAVEHPDLILELVADQDIPNLDRLTSGSGVILSWSCPQHGSYKRSVRHRVYGRGCRVCAGSLPEPGVGDLLSVSPHLRDFWDLEKNSINPEELFPTTRKKYWWRCPSGHSWEEITQKVSEREITCPGCALGEDFDGSTPSRPIRKAGRLIDAAVASSLHPSRNGSVAASELLWSSRERYWWMCPEGHEWISTVHNRSIGRGCPVCSGHQVVAGVNDLATTHPNVTSMWSPSNDRSPSKVLSTSRYSAFWICELGHEWESRVEYLTQRRDDTSFCCPVCSNRIIVPGFNDVATTHPHLVAEWSPDNTVSLQEVSAGANALLQWNCPEGHTWKTTIFDRTRANRKGGCPKCSSSSQGEKDLHDWVNSLGVKVVQGSRKIIGPLELDIYLPEHALAIEFNGIYWHSEIFLDKNYHRTKTDRCNELGIQLLHVWEDDWRDRQEIVKSMILAKLGMLQLPRVGARTCHVEALERPVANEFLNRHHIQGSVAATHYLGLLQGKDLVAVMNLTANPGRNELVLSRYATSQIVPGGFSKMLSYVRKNLEHESLVTYADLAVSDGGLYERNGFTLAHTTAPDYGYLVGVSRAHKFNFRKSKFKSNPDLLYEEGMTERELAHLNKMPRIYDCGKKVYRLNRVTAID